MLFHDAVKTLVIYGKTIKLLTDINNYLL